jgi:simple sugar transport system ATP-binding protein
LLQWRGEDAPIPPSFIHHEQERGMASARIELRALGFRWPGAERDLLHIPQLALAAGARCCVHGESGCGKSSLLGLLAGVLRPTRGEHHFLGQRFDSLAESRRDAIRADHVGYLFQQFNLLPYLSAVDNVMLPCRFSAVRRKRVLAKGRGPQAEAERMLTALGVPPSRWHQRSAQLSVGEQQRVEIAKTLYQGARVLILDEPTAVLVPQDARALFDALRRLTASGLGVLFISHKLHEVAEISHRVSVLRQGRIVDTRPTGSSTPAELAELMVGRSVAAVLRDERRVGPGPSNDEAVVIAVEHVSLDGSTGKRLLDDVDLRVHRGEILAIAGVSGNGQRELADILSGMRMPSSGHVRVGRQDITGATPTQVVACGLGRIPEDRHGSVVDDLSVEENLVLEDLGQFRRGPFLDKRAIRRRAEELIARFAIKAAPTDRIGGLSGGNMQKVLLARVLAKDPRAILVAQPTRGLDVGAGEYVHQQLLARRADGAAILLISEDLDEILALADRVAVIFDGAIMGIVDAATTTRAELGLMMAGTPQQAHGGAA